MSAEDPEFEKPFENVGQNLENMFEKLEIGMVGKKDDEGSEGGQQSDAGSDINLNKSFMAKSNEPVSQKHAKFISVEERAKDDMDFPDEVDTPVDEPARRRFIKYRGVKSFKQCEWDPFENLPQEYSKIWRFSNFLHSQKVSMQKAQQEGLPISGTYVKLHLSFDEQNPFLIPQS